MKSLMAVWFKASQWHGMLCHDVDLKVRGSNPSQSNLKESSPSKLDLNNRYK